MRHRIAILVFGLQFFSYPHLANPGTLIQGERIVELEVSSNVQCLACPPAEDNKSLRVDLQGSDRHHLTLGSGRALATLQSEILTDGEHDYGFTSSLFTAGPSSSTEFGYNRATSSLQFNFELPARLYFALVGSLVFDTFAPEDFRLDRGQISLSGTDLSVMYDDQHDDLAISTTYLIGPGDYELTASIFATGTQFESGTVWLDLELLAFAGDQAGDFDGGGTLNANDIDLMSHAKRLSLDIPILDLTGDGNFDLEDRRFWIENFANTFLGDANLDGQFDSFDFIRVFQAGEYEDGLDENSTWSTGDWNGDFEFDSGDLVVAFIDGGYELGPRAAVRNVPEPDWPTLALGLGAMLFWRRR